ncbi:MAG: substrate-binding domain-containing protein [Caulobacteraceae bacterium]|nr:substrate-binding domain-containing protein [Caulobacteraceae bacterium]
MTSRLVEKQRRHVAVMSAIAVKVAFERGIVPAFEASTDFDLSFVWQPTTVLMRQIGEGDRADVVVAIDDSMDRLASDRIIEPRTRAKIARASLGVAVRKGAPHPDISTVEAFRDALVNAKGVAYSTGGASGIYFTGLISRLGVSDKLAAVTIPAGFTAEKLVTGEADLAIQQMSELISVPGVEIVGPFPDEVQLATNFSAAMFKGPRNEGGAAAFLQALVSKTAHEAYEAAGLVSRLNHPAS